MLSAEILGLSYLLTLVLIVIFSITALVAYFRSKLDVSFLVIAIALGLGVHFANYQKVLEFPEKMIEPVPGMFKGEIVEVLRQNDKVARIVCNGEAKCKYFPHFKNTTLLLTIFKRDTIIYRTGAEIIGNLELRQPRPADLPTDFDEISYLKSIGADFLAFASDRNIAQTDSPEYFESLRENLYNAIYNLLYQNMQADNAAIAYALITGDKAKIPWQIKREFAVAGTAHILAVSGLHVGIIAMAIYVVLGFVSNPKIKLSAFVMLLFAYIWLTGFRVTALRAGIMLVLFMYFKLRQRQVAAINIISAVALINILIQPSVIYNIGFQMSILAISGIVLFYGKIRSGLISVFKLEIGESNIIVNSLALSFATSITLSPLIAYYFKIFSGVGFLANILVVPAALGALSFSALGILLDFIFIGNIFIAAADMIISIMLFINHIITSSFAFLIFETDALILATAFTGVLLILLYIKNITMKAVSALFVAGVAIMSLIYQQNSAKFYKIYPREQLTAVEINGGERTIFLLSERKPNQYAKRDLALEQYILSKKGDVSIAITGNSGIKLTDMIKDSLNFKIVELDHSSQLLMEKSLNLPIRLSQIIEYNYE